MTNPRFASIVLDVSIDKTLDYAIPEALSAKALPGARVVVPLRGRPQKGYIIGLKHETPWTKVHPIESVVSDVPLIPEDLFQLALWMARYYGAPLRQVFKMLLPATIRKEGKHKEQLFVMRGKTREELRTLCEQLRNTNSAQADVLDVMLKVTKGILLSELLEETGGSRSPVDTLAKKGYLVVDIVRVDRSPLVNEEYFRTKPKVLNDEQAAAMHKIVDDLNHHRFAPHLIHGVTGSGKTEIYLQAIEHALKLEKGTIVLVPEIALTTQMIERFRSRFEGHIAILHHRLSQGERFDEWHKIRRGEAQIVIGARSAVFSPVKNLGLLIVDEEHEPSYKQSEEVPCYHARDVAIMRGKLSNATVLLGSATPSLESYYNAQKGKYQLSELKGRADSASLPTMILTDMKKEFEKAKGYTTFSDKLLTGIKERQEKGEQTILFLNRRGYHTSLFCQSCSHIVKCAHCDVSLTFHKNEQILSCHLCGYTQKPTGFCPECKGQTMKYRGVGTEQVEKALYAIFPEIRTIRMDADTTRHKGSHQKLLREFGAGKADVLIGTQMIAKGLHFPQVTLVGVLNCDSSLNIPDFRASETIFQLITQVAGRSGRGASKGEVIIQSCIPENQTLQLASLQDYQAFYQEEIGIRELFKYPPFTHLVKVCFSGPDPEKTKLAAEKVRHYLTQHLTADFELQPVLPAGHYKVKDHYHVRFLIKGQNMYVLNQVMADMPETLKPPAGISLFVDVDPWSTYF